MSQPQNAEVQAATPSVAAEAPKPKKKHKGLKVFLTILLVFVGLVGGVIGAFYICFYDGTKSTFVADPNFSQQDTFEKIAVDSLDSTGSTDKIDFAITENEINQLLYLAMQGSASQSLSGFVKNFTVDIANENYNFYLEVELPLFKTRLNLKSVLSQEIIDDEQSFVFNIADMKIGRVGGIYNAVYNLFSGFMNDDLLNTLFASVGLSFTADLQNSRLYYKESAIIHDVKSIISDETEDPIFGVVLDSMSTQGLINFNYDEDSMRVGIPTTTLKNNESFCTSDKSLGIVLTDYTAKLKTLIDNGVCEDGYKQYAFDYLIRGYDDASTDAINWASSVDLSSIGISDYTTYNGVDLNYDTEVTTAVASRITPASIASGHMSYLSEGDMNEVLKSLDIIGQTYFLRRKVSDNNWKVNAITIDNLYCNIVNDHIYFVLGININGSETVICLDMIYSSSSEYSVTLNMNEIYYGNAAATADMKSFIKTRLAKTCTDIEWISFDSNTGAASLNLAPAIEASGHKVEIDAGTTGFALVGENLESDGYLDITFTA